MTEEEKEQRRQKLNAKALEEQNLDFGDRVRLGMQGASLNTSDEIGALARSVFGSGTYKDYLADERSELESARSKPGSLKYEIGGAFVPALAAAPFTGGTSIPLNLVRATTLAGAEGLAAGLGAREGDILERFGDRPISLGAETVASALMGPVAGKLMEGGQKLFSAVATPAKAMTRALMGRPAEAVETEVRRIASTVYPNLPPEVGFAKIVEEIRQGKIFPDLSEGAAVHTAGLVGTSSKGGEVIRDVVEDRADKFPSQARKSLQEDLVPENPQGNIVRVMNETTDELKKAEGAAYKRIFTDVDLPPSTELNRAVLNLTKMGKSNLNELEELIAARRLPPLFKKNDQGVLELTRNVSLEDGEILRRALQDSADSAFGPKKRGNLGQAIKEVELDLRSILDDLSPDLKTTRANWAQISKVKNTFDESRKIFGKTAEDAEIYIEDIIIAGNVEAIEAMRAGAASGLKAKFTGTSTNTVLRNLDNLDRKERIILEKLYPGDSAEEIFKKISRAVQATKTKGAVTGGSPTAHRLGAQAQQGEAAAEALGDAVALGAGDYLRPAVKFVQGVLRGSKLTPKQLEKVARIIITEDPEIMEKALLNPGIQQELVNKIQRYAGLIPRAASSAAAYQTEEKTRRLLDDPNR
jgi:hypothetical protein